MKIRTSSRITAIILALMMIVPLISVPTFATATKVSGTADQLLYSEDFEDVTDVSTVLSQYPNGQIWDMTTGNIENAGASIAKFDDAHGNAIKYDIRPADTHVDGDYFVSTGQNNWYAINVADDGWHYDDTFTNLVAVSGTVTISGKTYYVYNAEINWDANSQATMPEVKVYSTPRVDNGDGTYEYGVAEAGTYRVGTAKQRNAWHGQTTVANPSHVKAALGMAGQTFVFSADYYFDTNINFNKFDIRMTSNTKDIHWLQLTNSGNNVIVNAHTDISNANYGGTIVVNKGLTMAKGTWNTITVVVDCSNGSYTEMKAYLNGDLTVMATMPYVFAKLSDTKGWNLGHTNRGWQALNYSGNYWVDNIAIYNTTDVIPKDWPTWKAGDIYREDFESQIVGSTTVPSSLQFYNTSTKVNPVVSIIDTLGSKAFRIDTDFSSSSSDIYKGNRDTNLVPVAGDIAYGTYESIVIETDYYFPKGETLKIQSQSKKINGDKYATYTDETKTSTADQSWVDFYTLQSNGSAAWLQDVGDAMKTSDASDPTSQGLTKMYYNTLPLGKWFTISLVINLVSGDADLYIDGQLAAEFPIHKSDYYFRNIKIYANQLNIAKPNKTAMTGWFAVDNIYVHAGTAPVAGVVGTANSASIDFSAYKDLNGQYAPSAVSTGTTEAGPATATYTDELNGDWAVRVTMGSTATGEHARAFIAGVNSRVYYMSSDKITPMESFTPATTVDAELFAQLTKVCSKDSSSDKPIYVALVGNTAYVYNNNGNAVDETTCGKLTYAGEFTTQTSNFAFAMAGGDDNIDRNWRAPHPGFTYNADGNNTYVFSAEYYVDENAGGEIQAQFRTGYVDLYRLNLTNKTLTDARYNKKADLQVNAWNKITMIVTLDETAGHADVYINGVYAHTANLKANSIVLNDWILIKQGKESDPEKAAAYAGYIYVDDVQVNAVAYDESDVKSLENGAMIDTITVDGVTQKVYNTKGQVYTAGNATATYYDDSFLVTYATIINTVKQASIRLTNGTGLRFATEINVEQWEALKAMVGTNGIESVSFGTLIAPMDNGYMGGGVGNELTADLATTTVLNIKGTDGAFYAFDYDDTTTHFVGSIKNIKLANYDRAFSARGYVAIKMTNGTTLYIYSATTHEVSVADQAQKTIDEGLVAVGTPEYEIVAGFAAGNVQ